MEGIGINLPLLVAFVVNFLILFGLLSIVLYKPVLKMLDERQAKIAASMEQTEQIKEQAARSEEQMQAALEKARKEGQEIVARAAQIGERLKQEAAEGARKEAETLVNKARSEIDLERDKAMNELRADFAEIAILAAEKVIEETLDSKRHRKLIDEVLDKSTTFGPN